MLDELPSNSEPACPGPSGPAPHGFTTHNRFIRGKSQAYVGPTGCEGIRYHGLDYMLLHNLYAIATPGTWNGNPDADPCAPIVGDGSPTVGGDVGTTSDAGIDEPNPSGGCGCRSTTPGSSGLLLIALAWILRRRSKR
jgi:MYXO-CTERM domain-containing protein